MDVITIESPHYHTPRISDYIGNPLIEALAPIPESQKEIVEKLIMKPKFNVDELHLPAMFRKHFPLRLRNYMFPTSMQVQIYYNTLLQVLDGYLHRNPLTPQGQTHIHKVRGKKVKIRIKKNKPGTISFITGLSGMGKSKSIETALNTIGATVIVHHNYKGKPFTESQIVSLKNNVPRPISRKTFAKRYGYKTDKLLGTDDLYGKKFRNRSLSRDDYIIALHKIIDNHFVGILGIDDFQNIKAVSKSAKEDLISMLLDMRDELGIPIIIVGTYKALDILGNDASLRRRLVDGSYYNLKRPKNADDIEFRNFCESMWKYQWLRKHTLITDEIIQMLYDCSMGITGILLNLFIFAQHHALDTGNEFIDAKMIRKVYRERFKPFHNIIKCLQTNNKAFLKQYEDLYPKTLEELDTSVPIDPSDLPPNIDPIDTA